VEIHRVRRRLPPEEMSRRLEHVVGVARLRAGGAEVPLELVFREEGFAVAVAAVHERAMVDDALPEERGDVAIPRVARHLVFARGAYALRALSVGVDIVERIDALRERIDD